jgi:hypothetical protein
MSHYEGNDTTGWHLWELRVGDRIVAAEGGSPVEITGVSESAAYYKSAQENTYEVFDEDLGETKEITRRSSKVCYIAPCSFVEMIERGPIPEKKGNWSPPQEKAPTAPPKPRPELPPVKYRKTRKG